MSTVKSSLFGKKKKTSDRTYIPVIYIYICISRIIAAGRMQCRDQNGLFCGYSFSHTSCDRHHQSCLNAFPPNGHNQQRFGTEPAITYTAVHVYWRINVCIYVHCRTHYQPRDRRNKKRPTIMESPISSSHRFFNTCLKNRRTCSSCSGVSGDTRDVLPMATVPLVR